MWIFNVLTLDLEFLREKIFLSEHLGWNLIFHSIYSTAIIENCMVFCSNVSLLVNLQRIKSFDK